jgi:hypothetical protein
VETRVLLKGPIHVCDRGAPTITYGRIASNSFIDPKEAALLLGIADGRRVYVQLAEELWPNEEKEPGIFEVAIIPECFDATFPQNPEPKHLEWLFERARKETLWHIEETTHPKLTCEPSIPSSPRILVHLPETNTIGISIAGFFAEQAVPIIAHFIPEAKMEDKILYLPDECVQAEIKKDLHSPFITIRNKNGNPLVLFHEGHETHVHFFRDEFKPVVEAFEQYVKELEQEAEEMVREIEEITNDFLANIIQSSGVKAD